MADIFLKFLNMSISASWLALVVVILRLLLKKAPKWLNPVLWGIVGIRLILPFSIESILSLIPSAETISPEIIYSQEPSIHSGIPILNSVVNPIITESFTPNPAGSASPLQIWIPIAAVVWTVGIAAMLIYTVISYLRLSRRVKTAVLLRDHIYQSENVASPFVLGIMRPRIYLPFNVEEKDAAHVIAHEKTHIKRRDHWIKPFGFLLLALHWFNPVLWAAYILLCWDIELACDERVIKELGADQRADYSDALLSCSVPRRMIAACPLAFGEVGVKERVRNILNYKKPAFWLIVVAVVTCIVIAVCFLTNPKKAPISFDTTQITWANALDMRPNEPTSYNLSDAELGELKDRLGDLEVGGKNNDYGESTPMYSLSIKAQGMEQFMIASYNSDGTHVGLVYQGEYYRIQNDDFSKYLSNICAGGSRAEAPGNKVRLSLNDVIMLSQKGEDLSWKDFEQFSYVETGSGLYIRVYEINPLFSLCIGGGNPDIEPMYIRLLTSTEPEDAIDIRTEDVTSFISTHNDDLLEASITAAVLEHCMSERSAGLICVESHVILDKKVMSGAPAVGSSENQATVTVYALIYYAGYERYSTLGNGLETAEGSYIPTALTFGVDANGIYTLTEYWEPRDGSDYAPDIESKFPKDAAKEALNHQVYVAELSQECEKKALAIMKESGSIYDEISRLLYTITSSPLESSVPSDYITAHQSEYDTMVSYGAHTLRYCFTEFLKEDQTGLRGHIMAIACQDVMSGWGEVLIIDRTVSTGQDWFNLFRANAESMQTQYTHEELEKRYPAAWILLQLQGVGTRVYSFNEEDIMKTARVALHDDGTSTFTFSPISSYIGNGTYEIDGDRLALMTDDGYYTYVFDMVDDTLVFNASASSDKVWFSGITDGSVFK